MKDIIKKKFTENNDKIDLSTEVLIVRRAFAAVANSKFIKDSTDDTYSVSLYLPEDFESFEYCYQYIINMSTGTSSDDSYINYPKPLIIESSKGKYITVKFKNNYGNIILYYLAKATLLDLLQKQDYRYYGRITAV